MSREIARNIMEQMSKMELCALGAKDFTALNEATGRLGGLSFACSFFGRRICKVFVGLNGKDLYDVQIYTRAGKMLEESKDIYCQDLMCSIINPVEKYFRS